jgi:hypothetical protein
MLITAIFRSEIIASLVKRPRRSHRGNVRAAVVFCVTRLVVVILGAFTEPAAVVIRPPFIIESDDQGPRSLRNAAAEVFASQAVLRG